MQLTTQQVIKTIPFEESFKQEVMEKLPTLPEDVQYDIVQMIWEVYYAMYDLKFDENREKAFERARNNQEKLDKDFYSRIHEQTAKDMQAGAKETAEAVDLSTTRQKLQEILNKVPSDINTTQ